MADNEGMKIEVPLPEFVRAIAREAAQVVIREHVDMCSAVSDLKELFPRVRSVELKLASLVAFMAGAGLLGGGVGALVARLLTGS
jgi:hypothetical protein